jgi:hypothetical protein
MPHLTIPETALALNKAAHLPYAEIKGCPSRRVYRLPLIAKDGLEYRTLTCLQGDQQQTQSEQVSVPHRLIPVG